MPLATTPTDAVKSISVKVIVIPPGVGLEAPPSRLTGGGAQPGGLQTATVCAVQPGMGVVPGQSGPAPAQTPAVSQTLAGVWQIRPAGANASGGQTGEAPEQLSDRSHAPVLDRQ